MPMDVQPASAFEQLSQKRCALVDEKVRLAEAFDEVTEDLRAIERVIRILQAVEERD